MVSTRGGAQTGVDDQKEAELKLRKKPVRKAAAATKPAKAAPAAKTTRSKRVEPEQEDEEADELHGDGSAAAPKVVRKARAKKDDVSTTTTTTAPSKPAAATRARATTATAPGKTAATRAVKPSKTETSTPSLAPPAQTRTARATRATASTRATAAKEKAAPLSPKKITQMPKLPARNTRTTNIKAVVGKEIGKVVAKGKPATRRRGVSDENAGVPEFRPSTADQQSEEINTRQASKGTPAVSKAAAKAVTEPETIEIDNDTPMSTTPTTPAESVLEPDDDVLQDHVEASDSDGGGEIEISADELCGPKTPMKRMSPRELSKHTSAHKGRFSEDVPMETPARRFLVPGSQVGTPQTQKPYCKPRLPISEVRPTTAARARDRAMVFPKLQPLDLSLALEEADETAEVDDRTLSTEDEMVPMNVGQADISEASIHISEGDELSDAECALIPARAVGSSKEVSIEDVDTDAAEHDIVKIPFQMQDLSIVEAYGETEDEPCLAERDDSNETILVEDEDMGNTVDSRIETTLESAGSIVVHHDTAPEADESLTCDESMEDLHLPIMTPRPETIQWDNLREDVTIPFNFDNVLSGTRAPLQEPEEPMSSDECVEPQETTQDVEHRPSVETNMILADTQHQRQSFGDVRLSVDATVNLSDFLDMSSLAEQPRQPHDQDDYNDVDMEAPQAELDDDMSNATAAASPLRAVTPAKIPSTTGSESMPTLPDVPQQEPHHVLEPNTPHYAMPTIAFRRKSLPAIVYHTPMNGSRPKTSDGASIHRIANPFANMSAAQDDLQRSMTPFRLNRTPASRPQTPSIGTPTRMSSRKTPRTSGRAGITQTPRTSSRLSVRLTPRERFPGLPSRQTYEELASTPTAKTPGQFIPSAAKSSTKERFPALPPAEKYEDFVKTPASGRALETVSTTPQIEQSIFSPIEDVSNTVQPEERYPGLPHRRTYEEHARTAMPASRFRTPSQSPAKRPATVQKPASLRKMALKAGTPMASHTPVKTPLRAPAMTPGQIPLTPHPGAPLKGVNAYVDIFLNDGSSANSTYIAVLHSLGAKTTKTFNDRVTHVIYKEGSPATLQKLRIHNKQVIESGNGKEIFCVNGRWVNDSNSEGTRMDETDEAYIVDIEDQRATKRRRKSMEPTSLLNIGGNVVRDTNRKSSLGRSSIGRALKAMSPSFESPTTGLSVDFAEKENSGDSSFGDESPATPAYLAAPDSLIQQTAPMNRMRKLDFDAQEQAKNRRLTFWDGGEF